AGVIVLSQAASNNVLIAVGKHRAVTWIWMTEAAVNLALSIVFVRRIGLPGVALGTLLPLMAGHGVMLWMACRAVGMSIAACLREMTRPALIAGTTAAVACFIVRTLYVPTSGVAVLCEAAIVALVYAVSLATVGFDAPTRYAYVAAVRRSCAAAMGMLARRTGRRATKVEPGDPLSSTVTVP